MVVDHNMQKLQEEDKSLNDQDALIWAVLAYNSTPTFTGFAPIQMTFGVHNVLTPVQDLSPVECQQEDVTSRYLKDFATRDQAIKNHNEIRNSRKLRDLLLSRSKPTVEPKRLGSWVWYLRHGDWLGPAQVTSSLHGEASVKEGNSWLTCRHNELLPLTESELQRHGLHNDHHDLDKEDEKDDALTNKPPSDPQIVELEFSLPELLPPKSTHSSCQDDVRQLADRPGGSTRRNSDESGEAAMGSEPGDLHTEGTALSQLVEPEAIRSGNRTRKTPEGGAAAVNQDQDAGKSVAEPTGATAALSKVQQSRVGGEIQEVPQVSSAPPQSDTNQDESRSQQKEKSPVPPGFDPLLSQRPPVDVREAPLKRNQEVRIIHPVTKETQDVVICNGFKRSNQKSWYKVVDQAGKKSVLDFNEIFWDYKPNSNFFVKQATIDPNEPFSIFHTVIHPSRHHLPPILDAKEAEVKNHQKFGTFSMVKLDSLTPEQQTKIIPAVWAVVWKGSQTSGKYKGRLCARGDKEPNVDSIRTDAPTASKDSIRLLLTLAASMGWKLHSLDFQAAFCQGKTLERELYLNPPADLRKQNPGYVLKVIKAIYGLKDASRGWVLEVRDFLLQCQCVQSDMDKAVYYYFDKQGNLLGLIITHIDDFLFCGTPQFHEQVIQKVIDRYVIGAQEDTMMTFTGWQLKQSKEGIELSQQTYQDSIALDSFRHFKGYTAKDDEQLNENDQGMYRKMIGILNWMSSSSKPALAHSCSYYSSFLGKASKAHGKAVFRILEKAKTEPEVIRFNNVGNPKEWKLEVFTDAALGKAGQVDTYIGDIAFIHGNGYRNVINWQASKLSVPSPSILIGEAEAVNTAYGKVKYLRFLLNEMFGHELPATIYTDSKSLHSTVLSDNTIRNKRISAAVATIRAIKTKENIALHWISGLANASDPLTKMNANPANLKHLLSTGKPLDDKRAKIHEIDFAKVSFLG